MDCEKTKYVFSYHLKECQRCLSTPINRPSKFFACTERAVHIFSVCNGYIVWTCVYFDVDSTCAFAVVLI